MIDKLIEYIISFLKRFFFYITNLLIIMIYFASLELIPSSLKSYSENGQQFYSSNFLDVYPWSILIILVLAALPLLIHLKTKNNLDSKFLFSIKGFSINALLILLTIFFASQKEDNFEDQYDEISVQLDAENKFLFPRMEDFAYIDKKGIDDIFNKIALSDKSLTSLNNIVINKYHSRHLPAECNRKGLFETGGVSLIGQELADFIVVDKSYKEKISSFLPSQRCEAKKKVVKDRSYYCNEAAAESGDWGVYERCMKD